MEKFKSTNSQDNAKELFSIAMNGIAYLASGYKELSQAGICEALLFNTNLILNTKCLISSNQRLYIEDEYFLILYYLIEKEKPNMPQDKLVQFINNRLHFYMEDFNKLVNDKFYTGMFCYSNFYINPLHEDSPQGSTDTIELVSFKSALLDMIIWVQEQIN